MMENNALVKWASTHPRLAAWIILSVGMVAMLVYFGRDVGLTAFNWTALIIATVGTAGLCIWIISWEDAEEIEETGEGASENEAESV
jgi:hypothetical protein